jgi:hypothetical protein
MAFWAAIPMIASMGAQAMGKESARASTIEGAKSQAKIEAMKREYMQKIFTEDIDRLKPFYEAGTAAGIKYGDAIRNKLDPTQTGTYKQISSMISPDLEGAPEYVKERAFERLGAMEGERQKTRLMDLQQIGMGSAASAGTAGLNLGSMLAQSYGLSGNVMARGMQSGENQRQSMYNVAASQMSGLPSYIASGDRPATYDTRHMGSYNQSMVDYGGMGGR